MRRSNRTVIFTVLILALASPAVAQTFTAVGQPAAIQSLTFVAPPFPAGIGAPFGYVDITFVGGAQRFGVPLESQWMLADENLPVLPLTCDCEGLPGLSPPIEMPEVFVAYYYVQELPQGGVVMDGILIRRFSDRMCVYLIRRTTTPVDFVAVLQEPDCLTRQAVVLPSFDLDRFARILEALKDVPGKRPPKWPAPVCLSCPPWPLYGKFAERLDALHGKGLVQRVREVRKELDAWLEAR